ncbi:MAG: hypothetical protein AVDCRST_MAG44-1476, partial [uncultured Sphingomonas sp.]
WTRSATASSRTNPSATTCSPGLPPQSRRFPRGGSTTGAGRSCSRTLPTFPNITRHGSRPPFFSATAEASRRWRGEAMRWS